MNWNYLPCVLNLLSCILIWLGVWENVKATKQFARLFEKDQKQMNDLLEKIRGLKQ